MEGLGLGEGVFLKGQPQQWGGGEGGRGEERGWMHTAQ